MKVLICGGTGYIGSALYRYLREKEYEVDTLDLEFHGNRVNPRNIRRDYGSLRQKDLLPYDAVIVLAGHSSVPMCQQDPYGAFDNSVCNFVNLLREMEGTDKKLIYASSSCVYHGTNTLGVETIRFLNPVDHLTLTKTTIDRYAELSGVEAYGLRFGSVNGWSPNFRTDLCINAMVTDALAYGRVRVMNGSNRRPFLAMSDLVRAVERVLVCREDRRGTYNLSSWNASIGYIGEEVARLMDAQLIDEGETGTYDFTMDCGKFTEAFGGFAEATLPDIVESIVKNRHNIVLRPNWDGCFSYRSPRCP